MRWRDAGYAAVLVLVEVASAATSPPSRTALDIVGVALLAAGAAAIAFRLRAPLVVLAVAVVAAVGYEELGYPGLSPVPAVLFALYTAVRAGHRGAAVVAAAVMVAGGITAQLGRGESRPDVTQRWFLLLGWLAAAVVAGRLAQQQTAYLRQAVRRADEAERTREEVARRRADEERLRIARELHDSLTHSISIIKVQAGVAIHLARKRGEQVPEALLAIEQAGGEAMRELRATLEVLRVDEAGDDGDGSHGAALDRVERLVDGARRAGLPVTVDVSGEPRELPDQVGRAAYRIIQEALTNITRHAGPEVTASVRLGYHDGALTVRVDDDGPGPGDGAPGMGLAGMRERVSALGGTLRAGPGDRGGFTVQADLPLATS
jgi:signal transduction histidine kinase